MEMYFVSLIIDTDKCDFVISSVFCEGPAKISCLDEFKQLYASAKEVLYEKRPDVRRDTEPTIISFTRLDK